MRIQDITPELLQFAEAAAPATPAAGVVRIYAKTDGLLYSKNDAGVESPLAGAIPDELADLSDDATHRLTTDAEKAKWDTRALSFYIDGTLVVEVGAMSIIAPMALTVTEIRVMVDQAPTSASLIIDVNKNGTTMYTTQGNRPTITAGNTSVTATDPDVTAIALGDKITIDIDQVGSTVAGENLSVTIICEVA